MNASTKVLRFRIPVFASILLLAAMQGSVGADDVDTAQDAGGAHDRATWHVANNGVDSPNCGERRHPCRSITQAITNSHEGDLVLVGPGRYGDLNKDENVQQGEDFALDLTKRVTLASVAGAERTVIESLPNENAIAISANEAVFGLPQKGFTVTGGTNGVSIEAQADVRVIGNIARGNQRGFLAGLGSNHKLVGNLASDNELGFEIRGIGVRVIGNVAASNGIGFEVSNLDSFVERNIAVSNDTGFNLTGFRNVLRRNSAIGNRQYGIRLFADQFGTGIGQISIQQSNIYGNKTVPLGGNLNCGILNESPVTVQATNNFWGAPTGPGPDPADEACDVGGGQLVVTPFATKEFRVDHRWDFDKKALEPTKLSEQ